MLVSLVRRVRAILAMIVFWPWSALMATLVHVFSVVRPGWTRKPHHWWGLGACRLFGVKVDFRGVEHLDAFRNGTAKRHSGVILTANHESLFDIFVLAALPFNFAWIAKEQTSKFPFIGGAMKRLGFFFLRRDGGKRDISTMKVVEDGLRRGESVAIFPEGTRSRTGDLLPLKKGAFRTSVEANAPIVPVRIRGTFAITPGGKLPTRVGHRVSVTLGAPLFPAPGETPEQLLVRYERALGAL